MQLEVDRNSTVSKDHPLSVSQLTVGIKELLESAFPELWIRGELSNIRIPGSGHLYATLKDETAQIRLVMFRNQIQKNPHLALNHLKDGMEVLVKGGLSVYGPQGSYQILASVIETVGSGAMQAKFEAIKQKLALEGLFDSSHKTPLPFFPSRIGVITSPQGAALRDILNIVQRRFPGMSVDIYPAVVQGEDAPRELMGALKLASDLGRVDVLILGRGGGSMEDLWCFNDEALARAVFSCPIPVVSAVGHEIDFTIVDFVSDQRAPTPSAAAELVVPEKVALLAALNDWLQAFQEGSRLRLNQEKKHLESLFHQLEHPRHKLQLQFQKLETLSQSLHAGMDTHFLSQRETLGRLGAALSALNPKSVLDRGFALISHSSTRQVVSSSKKIRLKEKLTVTFHDGPIEVRVEDVPLF